MTAEEVARRLANSRPGFQLVSYREVALPLFKVDLELLVLERKSLPPIQEYVLRAVEQELSIIEDIAGLLGIDAAVVQSTAVELLSGDDLVLSGGEGEDRTHRLQLTAKGRRTAAEAASVQAVEVSLPVWIDGLTRRVLSVTGKGHQWFPAGRANERGLVEVAASPRRRPNLSEIPLESVREVIKAESAGRRAPREVIGMTGIGKARRFAREAAALAYRAPGEDDPLITLVVDGEPSDEHDAAFSRARARSARRLTPEHWRDARVIAERALPVALIEQAASADETDRLERERDELRQEDRQLRSVAERASTDELEALREQLEESDRRQRELQQALDNISVRQVPVYEHRAYLERALAQSRSRILIVSPWIRFEVVDDELIGRLRKVLDRGVEIWIGYGINKQGGYRPKAKGEGDRNAERKLRRLAQDYSGLFHMTRLGDTHAKVLVCDSRFSIITSFNWLSFRGDDQLEFRDERGYYVGLPDKVDELFESYRGRFDVTDKPPRPPRQDSRDTMSEAGA